LPRLDEAFLLQRTLDLQQRQRDGGGDGVDWKTFETSAPPSPSSSAAVAVAVGGLPRPPPEEWRISSPIASSILQMFFSQILQWPEPIPGKSFLLPLCGDYLSYSVAERADLFQGPGPGRGQLSLHPVLASLNLMSLLGPHGLLQHLW
jgi:hypothetical protein